MLPTNVNEQRNKDFMDSLTENSFTASGGAEHAGNVQCSLLDKNDLIKLYLVQCVRADLQSYQERWRTRFCRSASLMLRSSRCEVNVCLSF